VDQRIVSVSVVVAAFLLTACSGLKEEVRACSGLKGEVRNGRYLSPAGNFTMSVPKSLGQIYVVDGYDEDSGYGFVQVATDVGDLEQVSYDREDEFLEKVRALQASGRFRDFMRSYFGQRFLPKNYPPSSKASVESGPVFLPSQHGEMLFAVVRLPEGSGAFDMKAGKRHDGIRGVLLFFRDGYSYHLHKEATGMFDPAPSTEDARKRVLALYEKIDFRN